MATPDSTTAQAQIASKMEETKRLFGPGIVDLLKELNGLRLKSKGRVTLMPIITRNSLRWSLAWSVSKISYELSVILRFEYDGQSARVASIWVHRHVATTIDFEGHTPTTRMHRVANLTIPDIRAAIELEWT